MQIYLIRHGEVEEKYHKVFGGSRIDMGLSPLGLQQGTAVAAWLKDTKIDALYASPMLRVQQTLAPLARLTLAQVAPVLPYLLLVVMLVVRPKGLMGRREG